MKLKIRPLIIILALPALAFAASADQAETEESLMQKLESQQQQIDKLKTEAIEQRKQIVQLKSELFTLKYGSPTNDNGQSKVADEFQNLQSQVNQLQKENKRLTRLCELSGVNPKSDPNNIQQQNTLNTEPRPNKIIAGQRFPRLKFKAVDGLPVDIDKLQGKVVLIDFWATWCGPCVKEMPNLISTYHKHREKGFEIIGISLDNDLPTLKNYLNQNQITWPQHCDGKGWDNMISSRFNIRAIPFTVLIDRKGIVQYLNLRGQDLETAVETLCQSSEQKITHP
jgi:thiol-disulfide isomerase/thioredoxin